METARQYDAKVLIEEAVVGSEVGCAILGNGPDLLAGEVDQIALSHGFFDDDLRVVLPCGLDRALELFSAGDLGDAEGRP